MVLVLADVILVVHAAVVVFVAGGLPAIWIGRAAGWRWVDRRSFRLAHLGAIVFVAVQSWLGALCPLTTLESWLREQGGAAGYDTGFVEQWLHRLLFHAWPSWVFTLAYTVFAAAVAATWWRLPPAPRAGAPESGVR